MMLMVNSINKDNFGGVRVLTCYTCHRGNQHPKVIPSLEAQYGEAGFGRSGHGLVGHGQSLSW
jgi:hypothetical protein